MVKTTLSHRPYLAGAGFSMADIPVGIMAHWWYRLPIERFEMPGLEAWYRRLAGRPAFQEHVAAAMASN
ncbi:MAG: hypothetical protein FJX68_15015 [Alphaproteobacteria bacterium]|nr:hypothetical protein [Alphaproteobacteria bacterium]